MPAAKPTPKGFHTVNPYITADGADKVVTFLQKAFGAEIDHEPMKRPDGKLMHATLRVGDSMVMIAEASERAKAMPASLYLYLPDVDAAYQRAIKAGATSVMEPADQFYGDRVYAARDPEGHVWSFGQTVREVSREEAERVSGLKIEGWV